MCVCVCVCVCVCLICCVHEKSHTNTRQTQRWVEQGGNTPGPNASDTCDVPAHPLWVVYSQSKHPFIGADKTMNTKTQGFGCDALGHPTTVTTIVTICYTCLALCDADGHLRRDKYHGGNSCHFRQGQPCKEYGCTEGWGWCPYRFYAVRYGPQEARKLYAHDAIRAHNNSPPLVYQALDGNRQIVLVDSPAVDRALANTFQPQEPVLLGERQPPVDSPAVDRKECRRRGRC